MEKQSMALPGEKTGILSIVFISLAVILFTRSRATDDLGLCTIKMSGDDLIYEEISIEECQEIFGNTTGAGGWSWDPQD
ncbi:MAG: hypothetical protein KAR19_11975 [Bacteroidales bacterium]|nr:hypothetical protein [Bacteroidales bacterium]